MRSRFEVHMHFNWSNTRLLDAITELKSGVDYAQKIGLKGISITDHGCVCGWVKANQLQKKLKENGSDFKIALGEEGYLVDKRENGIKYYHCIWIAKDAIGAKQIRRISSIANLNSYFDRRLERVPIEKNEFESIIKKDPGHIIVTSACLGGEVSSSILEMESARHMGATEVAEKAKQKIINFILWMKDLIGDDFYLEVAPAASKEQITVNKKMVELSKVFNIKMVLGCDAHYLRKEDRYVHEAYLNSKGGERETAQFYQYAYLQTEEEIIENLTPSIVDMYDEMCKNSMEIFNKIEYFDLHHPQTIPHIEVEDYVKYDDNLLKDYPILHDMKMSDNKIERYWVNECVNKLKSLGKQNKTYLSQLEEEADIKRTIGKKLDTNMFSYPIVLSKYIDKFWELGSTVGAGRGSACSGLNHYLLGVTQLDPIEWNFPFFRYMNRDTDGLGDIDIDLAPSKIGTILKYLKHERSQNFPSDLTDIERESLGAVYVCTFGTESTKSAILTACRGYRSEQFPDGIDNDIAQYLSSLVPTERGFVWSIKDVTEGNPEKGRRPSIAFMNEVEQYPGLLDIIKGIEGLISRKGRHASGVLLSDEDPYQFNAYMKTPSGEVVTQFDLHDAEYAGSTKFDLLVTEIQDKIIQTIKFLQEDKIIEPELTLKEVYDKYLHPDVLPIETDKDTWSTIQGAASLDLFQLDSEIGRQGAKKVRPKNMLELSAVNGLIRLMTTEKGAETWLDKYIRFKNSRNELLAEYHKYGLTEYEVTALERYVKDTYGIGISQEQFMRVIMDEDICGFSLKDANKARKVISKKKMDQIPVLKQKIFLTAKSDNLARYVWDYIAGPGMGYSFSDIHSLSYSFIGFQSAYLATHWNPIYWDTACLVVNSGSLEEDEIEIVNIYEKENNEDYTYTDLKDRSGKKKEKNSDYGKIAKAIGEITSRGIEVSLVNINTSDYGFKPDVENNRILYGLKALSNINAEIIEQIKAGRPYLGVKDFINRCPQKRIAMINLIKAGAFDEVEKVLPNRRSIMAFYISIICGMKNKLTLQNFSGLANKGLIPKQFDLQIRGYNFNKYIRKIGRVGDCYKLDEQSIKFFERFIPQILDFAKQNENGFYIKQNIWDSIYKNMMNLVRDWLKENHDFLLKEYNKLLFLDEWNKYAEGTPSAWEMASMCYYHGEHELAHINNKLYDISNFKDLPSEKIERFYTRRKNQIPIYELYRIAGTVLTKDDTRHNITLLTTTGVVTVKMSNEQYSKFKKQISQVQADGSKKVLEKSWFKRGNKLLITGFRRGDMFQVKTYADTPTHQIYLIEDVSEDGKLKLRHERIKVNNIIEEDYDD